MGSVVLLTPSPQANVVPEIGPQLVLPFGTVVSHAASTTEYSTNKLTVCFLCTDYITLQTLGMSE
jgi:hypothetical protein